MPLNEKIKEIRKLLDMTQIELAQELGLRISYGRNNSKSSPSISSYENGRRVPSVAVLTKLIKLCKRYNLLVELP
jgi:transcriptional regulator with XRE-family HTH domain